MSYILEAMRRAQADRHRGEVPRLSEPAAAVPAPAEPVLAPQPARVGIWVSAVLGLAIGFAGYALLKLALPGPSPTASVSSVPPAPVPAAGVGVGGTLPAQSWGGNGQIAAEAPDRTGPVGKNAAVATKPGGAVPQAVPRDTAAPAPVVGKTPKGSAAPASQADPEPSPMRSQAPAGGPGRNGSPAAANAGARAGAGSAGTTAGVVAPSRPVPAGPASAEGSTGASARANAANAPPTAAVVPTAPAMASLPRVRDLPPELQRDVPPLLVSGWVQSADPASRQLLVNGVLLREGDALTPLLRLELIGTRTAIFSVRGQRFEVPIVL